MKRITLSWSGQTVLLSLLTLTIPAFYLSLTGTNLQYRDMGRAIYAIDAILLGTTLWYRTTGRRQHDLGGAMDAAIFVGTCIWVLPLASPWSTVQWIFRMGYCALVFTRLTMISARYVTPNRLLQIGLLALVMLAIAGAGFFWLEPNVESYSDGIWLAFTTGATVGYGDLVPSTTASRIFAAFIVLLGYALFSVVTASIAALFVGEDEKKLKTEMHADLRALRKEIVALHAELRELKPHFANHMDSTTL